MLSLINIPSNNHHKKYPPGLIARWVKFSQLVEQQGIEPTVASTTIYQAFQAVLVFVKINKINRISYPAMNRTDSRFAGNLYHLDQSQNECFSGTTR